MQCAVLHGVCVCLEGGSCIMIYNLSTSELEAEGSRAHGQYCFTMSLKPDPAQSENIYIGTYLNDNVRGKYLWKFCASYGSMSFSDSKWWNILTVMFKFKYQNIKIHMLMKYYGVSCNILIKLYNVWG